MRVFRLTAFEGATRSPDSPLEDPLRTGRTARQYIEEALQLLSASPDVNIPEKRETFTTPPNLRSMDYWLPPVTPEVGDPQIWFVDARNVVNGHLLVTFKHGYFGEYDEAMGSDGAVDLSQHAPSRTFRALILLPAAGTEGRLVIETIKNRCPVTMFTHWISWASHQADSAKWIALRTPLLRDRDQLKKMVRSSSKIELELKEMRPASPGRRRGVRKKLIMEIESRQAHKSVIDKVVELLDGSQDPEYVQCLEKAVGFDPSRLDDASLNFDEASVEVTGADAETKKINLARLSDWFTYDSPVGADCTDDEWVDAVRTLLAGALSEGTDIQV